MKFFIACCFAAVLLVASSCRHTVDRGANDEVYDMTTSEKGELADFFSEVELVPLVYGGNDYPKQVNRLVVADSLYIVGDNGWTQHLFTKMGKQLGSTSEKFGKGPGEIDHPVDFSWNPYNDRLQVLMPGKMMIYDSNLNFIESRPMPGTKRNYLYSVSDLSPNLHIMMESGYGGDDMDKCRFIVFDSGETEKKRDLPYGDCIAGPGGMQKRYLYTMPDGELLIIPPSVTYRIFSLDTAVNELRNKILFDFGSNSVTREDVEAHASSPLDMSRYMMTTEKEVLLSAMPTSRRIVVTTKDGDSMQSFHTYLINRETGSVISADLFKGPRRIFPMIHEVDEDYAYAVMLKEELEESPELLLDMAEKAESILDSIEDESLIVMKYRFKP